MKNRFEQQPSLNFPEQSIKKFGIGHLETDTAFSEKDIPLERLLDLIEGYQESENKIRRLLGTFAELLKNFEIEDDQKKIFEDLLNSLEKALYKTINLLLYHGKINNKEALNAFDEFAMLLEIVNGSLLKPKILKKRVYKDAVTYELSPDVNIEHRDVESIDTLFSGEHIAWNVVSRSKYDTKGTSKSGVRLDYGPLYSERGGKVDKTKTEWVTSVDVSGKSLDKVMNQHSERGHHYIGLFKYKISLLIPGLAKRFEQIFDSK